MKLAIVTLLSSVFFLLALVHFYWAFGGQWGFNNTLPTNELGVRVLNPGKIDSIVVGISLCVFGLLYLTQTDILKISLPSKVWLIGRWIVPVIFLLRAIGDFKYVGFFKEIKLTEFAKIDLILYSPLCLIISILGFILIKIVKAY